MPNSYGISDEELNIIKKQAQKRAEYRQLFLKERMNPFKDAEGGYVVSMNCITSVELNTMAPAYAEATNKGSHRISMVKWPPWLLYKLFDPALQRHQAMIVTSYERFQPHMKNGIFGITAVILPMLAFGYLVWNERTQREKKFRSGEIKYKDRIFKAI